MFFLILHTKTNKPPRFVHETRYKPKTAPKLELRLVPRGNFLPQGFSIWKPDVLIGLDSCSDDMRQDVEQQFRSVWRIFAPELQHTFYPAHFTAQQRRFPQDPPLDKYAKFAMKIKQAWEDALKTATLGEGQSDCTRWVKVRSYQVHAVHRLPPASQGLKLPLNPFVLVSRFLDIAPFQSAQFMNKIATKSLFPRAGALGAVVVSKVRRLVVLTDIPFVADPREMAQSIEGNPWFCSDDIWEVPRAFRRHHSIHSQTNVAESVGGILSHYWDPTAGQQTGGLIARLMLRSAGFVGDGADEVVVEAVCQQLDTTSAQVGERQKRRAKFAGLSDVDIVKTKLVPQLSKFKTHNSNILCSEDVANLLPQLQQKKQKMSAWGAEMAEWKKRIDVTHPSPADHILFNEILWPFETKARDAFHASGQAGRRPIWWIGNIREKEDTPAISHRAGCGSCRVNNTCQTEEDAQIVTILLGQEASKVEIISIERCRLMSTLIVLQRGWVQ